MKRVSKIECDCEICARFNELPGDWNDKREICDICKLECYSAAPWVPSVLGEFMSISRLCLSCRHQIRSYVNGLWQLCWANDSDRVLKWAILDWFRSMFWPNHFRLAVDGFSSLSEQIEVWRQEWEAIPKEELVACEPMVTWKSDNELD